MLQHVVEHVGTAQARDEHKLYLPVRRAPPNLLLLQIQDRCPGLPTIYRHRKRKPMCPQCPLRSRQRPQLCSR